MKLYFMIIEPKVNFIRKLPDITPAEKNSGVTLVVEISKPTAKVTWLW